MGSARGGSRSVHSVVRQALRPETRRRDGTGRRRRDKLIAVAGAPDPVPVGVVVATAPPAPWSLGSSPHPRAVEAVAAAHLLFGKGGAADAVLGWLFAAFPIDGATGSDMVAHHARLRSDTYYERWVALCTRLSLFPRDP